MASKYTGHPKLSTIFLYRVTLIENGVESTSTFAAQCVLDITMLFREIFPKATLKSVRSVGHATLIKDAIE
jgi:hypothetical protein